MGIFFGTDGIRGIVNSDLSKEICFNCGNALTSLTPSAKILIGTDTRVSASLVGTSFAVGAISGGASVTNIGVCPTAGISYLTKLLGYSYGVAITASHNPPEFNGIKIFNSSGFKLDDRAEEMLERNFIYTKTQDAKNVGSIFYRESLVNNYTQHLINATSAKLSGLKIVIDASNGAGYKVCPKVFKALGAKVILLNCKNDGLNINQNCGSLHPEILSKKVVETGADLGIALDGDADRIIAVDEKGEIVDGDIILFILAKHLAQKGKLNANTVVGTRHTNMGLEKALQKEGIKLIRTDIGDKYVIKELSENNLSLGGEQSGHIIITEHEATGDGILTGVVLASIITESKTPLSKLKQVQLFPQCNINCLVHDKMKVINSDLLSTAIKKEEKLLKSDARVMVRVSGTEPKIRIMVEAKDYAAATASAERIKNVVEIINSEC